MKKIYFVVLSIILTFAFEVSAQVAINTDGSSADGTAILDVKSTTQGLLIPRMTTVNRTDITTPANGLIVFDIDTKSVWFYEATSTSWKEIYGSNNNTTLSDSDGDTRIEVEATPDNDEIRFYDDLETTYVFKPNRIDMRSLSTLIGDEAGANTTANAFGNTAIGRLALNTNVSNTYSTAIGHEAMRYASDNSSGSSSTFNTAIGYGALRGSTTAANNFGALNTAIGSHSLHNNTSGSWNTALGYESLNTNSSGSGNIAIGYSSLYWNSTGSNNIAVGIEALGSNSTGQYNTALGQSALTSNRINSRSTAIGYQAMGSADNRTADGRETFNTALGYQALKGSSTASANTGQYNTAVGDASMLSNTNGEKNVAVGNSSLTANTEGSFNTVFGSGALANNTTGIGNTALGYNSLSSNITRENSTAVGINSLATLSTGSRNTAIGEHSLFNLSSGSYNLSLGGRAAYYMTSGSNNIFIGYSVSAPDLTGSNQLNIGNTIYGTNIHNSSAKIGINVTSPDETLDVRGNIQVKNSSGAVTANIESSNAAATLFIKSSGSNLGQITFFDSGSYGASIGYSNNNDRIFLWHDENNIFFENGTILPGGHMTGDLGADGQAWDDIYCDDLHNQGVAAFTNRIVTEEIINHPPKEKTDGSFDYKTERGQIELDPSSLPDDLHDENSILTDEVVTYNYKANYEQQLQINELKKTIEQQNEKIEQLIKLVTEK